jgi:hypothetical protein
MPYRALRVAAAAAVVLAWPVAGPGAQDRRPVRIADGFDAYARGEFEQVADAIRRIDNLIKFAGELRHEATAWVDAASPAEIPRRRTVVATVALETSLAMSVGRAEAAAAVDLVQWACTLVRRNPVRSEVEHLWHRTALAALQRIMIPGLLERQWRDPIRQVLRAHIGHGLERYPSDPAWSVGTVISIEVSTPASGGDFGENPVRQAIRAYEKLFTNEAIAAEAHLRTAHLLFRRDHRDADAALSHLDHVEAATSDPILLYLSALVRGRIRERGGDVEGAAVSYESALTVWPGAQSAATALAAIRFKQDRRKEALALAQVALQKPVREDPWRHYDRGDYRLEELLRQLRKATQ